MPRNKRLHFKDIHAMRALAFIPVYLYCILFLITSSQSGVLSDVTVVLGKVALNSLDFFFFLSAFLITSHALREYKYLESFSLKNFLFRRVFRIAVVLLFALIFTFVLHPWLIRVLDLHPITTPSIEPYLFLLPNYFSNFNGAELLYLVVICSIYMFIQFYIFWGVILKFFSKYLSLVSWGLIGLGIVIRVIHIAGDTDYVLDTLAYGTPIGIGALTAIAVRKEHPFVQRLKELPKNLNTFIYILGFILLPGGYVLAWNSYSSAIIPLLTGAFFAYVIIEQTFGKNSFVQLKSKKVLSYLGKISYGMLVYQAFIGVMIMIAVESLDFDLSSFYIIGVIILAGFIGSVVIADISFKLLEKPLIRIRREFKKV